MLQFYGPPQRTRDILSASESQLFCCRKSFASVFLRSVINLKTVCFVLFPFAEINTYLGSFDRDCFK